jgi:hypothetical protein
LKLVCPSCGAACAAEAWTNDGEARQALRIVAELPESVSRRAIAYLALFRPMSGRGLKWSTALRHLAELDRIVRESHVQWDANPARPNDSRFWGQAMDRLVELPPKKLPLKSHGYLRAMVYDIADDADRQAEQRRNAAEASGVGTRRSAGEGFTPLDPAEMRRIREAKIKSPGGMPGL